MLRVVIWHLFIFLDLGQSEKLFEIKAPLHKARQNLLKKKMS